MNQFIHKLKLALFVGAVGAMAGSPVPAVADDLNIADSPLFVATNVEPNVMFTLDDSGSMQWEIIPDSNLFGVRSFMFPRPDDTYGGFMEQEWVPIPWGWNGFPNNFYAFFSRSANNNPIYYNPETNYRPWVRADGTEMVQAEPDDALYNPDNPGVGDVDLTQEQSDFAVWFANTAPPTIACFNPADGCDSVSLDYWPITFFQYKGTGDPQQAANYFRYQIRDSNAFRLDLATNAEISVTQFTWGDTTRTIAQETQNFANWFQYHRSRVLSSRAGIGRAFTRMPDQARVGFAAINQGEREIDGVSSSQAVITGVRNFGSGTVADDGRSRFYDSLYSHVINGRTPLRTAANAVGQYFERTDSRGPWSTTPGASGGEDLACRQSFHILMSDGFWNGPNPTFGNADGTAGTTITGPDVGAGTPSFTYTPVSPFSDAHSNTLADVAMQYWKRDLRPDVSNLVSTTPEDPAFWQHLTSFGIGLGVEGNQPPDEAFAAIDSGAEIPWADPGRTEIQFIGGNFRRVVVDRDNNGAAIDDLLHFGVNGRGGFFSATDPATFAQELGDLLLEIVSRTAATTGLSVSTTRLTEGSRIFAAEFDSEDWSGNVKAIDVFEDNTIWEADLDDPNDRKILTSNAGGTGGELFKTSLDDTLKALIDPDEGTADKIINYVRGNDIAGFRERDSLLGDIVNSRPVFVGESNEGWRRLPGDEGDEYRGFVLTKEDKTDAVYVGGNAGMLHAFNADTGDELFGYVPRAVLPKLEALTKDPYRHQFFVDGQIVVRDAWNGSSWRRVLVGGLGAGGRGIFAIDVTNPGSPEVLWDITDKEQPDLGFTFGDPVITRLADGKWVAIFGNGYNGDGNKARLFVVDLFSNGNVRDKDTTVLESSSGSNGLSGVAPLLDPETRQFTTRVYAGDLNGTVWRVDFDAGSGAADVKYDNGLFTDPAGRPITSTPGLAANPGGGLFVYVGTGKLIEPEDRLGESLALEHLYALRDQESALSSAPDFGEPSISNSPDGRVITGESGEDGWVLDLSENGNETGERVLARPRIIFGQVIFSTFEPAENPCSPGGIQRLYVLDALTGGGTLPICQNCGVVNVGIGAPIDPPVIIVPPAGADGGPDPDDPTNPFNPGNLPGGGAVGARSGWCSQFGTLNPATGQPLLIGTICDGRQVWRQAQ